MGLGFLDQSLWLGSMLGAAAILYRLVHTRLLPRYRPFALMLAVGLARDIGLHFLPYTSHSYTRAWELSLIAVLTTQCAAAIAAWRRIVELYQKIGRVSSYFFSAGLMVAILIGGSTLSIEVAVLDQTRSALRACFVVQHWLHSVIALGFIAGVLALSRFPRPVAQLPRNLVTQTALLTAYFASYSVLYLIENFGALGAAVTWERYQLASVALLYGACAILLDPKLEMAERWRPLPAELAAEIDARNANARALRAYFAK